MTGSFAPRFELAGMTVGYLRVESLAATSRRGSIWWCSCTLCGRRVQRVAHDLVLARAMQRRCACRWCANEMGLARLRRVDRFTTAAYVRMQRVSGDSYGPNWYERVARAVRRDLRRAGYPDPSTDPIRGPIEVVDGEACDERTLEGSSSSGGATLQEIGAELGLTRERVRQIEIVALEKCRRAFRRLGWGNADGDRSDPAALVAPALVRARERAARAEEAAA